VGALWGVTAPRTQQIDYCDPTDTASGLSRKTIDRPVDPNTHKPLAPANCSVFGTGYSTTAATPGFFESFLGDTPRPRVSIGFGVNWNSPFGPFRIDIAKALVKSKGDDDKLITFNVGTAF
jgi:hypothetical protein